MSQSVDIHMGSDLAKRQAWPSSSAVVQDDPSPARPTHPAAFIGNPAPLGLLAFGMTTCNDRENSAVSTRNSAVSSSSPAPQHRQGFPSAQMSLCRNQWCNQLSCTCCCLGSCQCCHVFTLCKPRQQDNKPASSSMSQQQQCCVTKSVLHKPSSCATLSHFAMHCCVPRFSDVHHVRLG